MIMRKKILSVLLALCMVLALLPVAAFAAKLTDAQVAELKAKGYTDEQIQELNDQIAAYESDEIVLVFEDTAITEAESRLVVVVGKCNVEVSAALGTGIVVAPGAADAKVALKAGADVNAVVVLDKAEVVVEKDAKATYVTLAAAEAAATVQGTVDTLAVNELAEKATVTVAEGAAVAAVEVAAPAAKADIAGTVSTVVVAETAKGAATTVASTATVSAVTVAAPEAKTDVAGTVSSVTVAETAEGAATTVSGTVDSVAVDAPNTKTEVAGTGSVGSVNVGENATGTEINAADGASVGEVVDPAGNNSGNTAAEPEPSPSPSTKPSTPAPVDPEPDEPDQPVTPPASNAPAKLTPNNIQKAPLEDHAQTDPKTDEALSKNYAANVSSTGSGKLLVTFSGEVASHTAGNGTSVGNWVGIGIPKQSADGKYEYKCYLLRVKETTEDDTTTTTAEFGYLENDSEMSVNGVDYNTYYFNAEAGKAWKETTIYVVATEIATPEQANDTLDALADGQDTGNTESGAPAGGGTTDPENPGNTGAEDPAPSATEEANEAVETLVSGSSDVTDITAGGEGESVADKVQEIKDTMENSNANIVVGDIDLNFDAVTTPAPVDE